MAPIICYFYNASNITVTLLHIIHMFALAESRGSEWWLASECGLQRAFWLVCTVPFRVQIHRCVGPAGLGCAAVTGTPPHHWLRAVRVSSLLVLHGSRAAWVSGCSAHCTHWHSRQIPDVPARETQALEGLEWQLMLWQTSRGWNMAPPPTHAHD